MAHAFLMPVTEASSTLVQGRRTEQRACGGTTQNTESFNHTHTHTQTRTRIHTHTHTHTDRHIDAHTHTHTPSSELRLALTEQGKGMMKREGQREWGKG